MKNIVTNDYSIFHEQYNGKGKVLYRKNSFLYNIFKPFEKHRFIKIAELIPHKHNRVLDIGCGDGLFLYNNREKWREVVGIDVVDELLVKARKRKYLIPAHFELADYGRSPAPYPSSSFDLVISISTLQYVYNLDMLFSQVHRILKKGGNLIFSVPNSVSFWRRIYFLLGRLPHTSRFFQGWDAGIIHYFTKYDLEKYVTSYGFTIKKITCSGIFDSLRSIWPSLLGGDLIFVLEK